jgi:hypothetical protein
MAGSFQLIVALMVGEKGPAVKFKLLKDKYNSDWTGIGPKARSDAARCLKSQRNRMRRDVARRPST